MCGDPPLTYLARCYDNIFGFCGTQPRQEELVLPTYMLRSCRSYRREHRSYITCMGRTLSIISSYCIISGPGLWLRLWKPDHLDRTMIFKGARATRDIVQRCVAGHHALKRAMKRVRPDFVATFYVPQHKLNLWSGNHIVHPTRLMMPRVPYFPSPVVLLRNKFRQSC